MNEDIPWTLPLKDLQPTDTSGTVGTTIVDTITVVERAAARCGKKATSLTPEDLDTAKTNLFLILSKMCNRGLNLWAVEQFHLPVIDGKVRYQLPTATHGIVNIVYRTVQRLAASLALGSSQTATATFAESTLVTMLGFKLPAERTSRYVIETSADGSNWDTVQSFETVTLSAGWHWYTLDASVTCLGVRLRDTTDTTIPVLDLIAAHTIDDKPLTQFNRDEYTGLNNKFQRGAPSTYYFEKKIESAISFWPVPTDETGHFVLWRHRAVQDVGSLSNRLEIPDRWIDAIIWMLAKNLSAELDGVTPDRIQLCRDSAAEAENDAELGESDGAPMYMRPNISGYTA